MHPHATHGHSRIIPSAQKKRREKVLAFSALRALPCVEVIPVSIAPTAPPRGHNQQPKPGRFSLLHQGPKDHHHEAENGNSQSLIRVFLQQIGPLREKAGPVPFQLPPSLAFDAAVAERFLGAFRERYSREVTLEPRHEARFLPRLNLLRKHSIARSPPTPRKGHAWPAEPSGNLGLIYYRLHGSPRAFYSNYEDDFMTTLAARVRLHKNAWVIFDDTALSHAYAQRSLPAEADPESSPSSKQTPAF